MFINTAASFMDSMQKYQYDKKTIPHIPNGSSGQGLVDQGHSTNKNVLCLHAGCRHAHKTTKPFPWIIWPYLPTKGTIFPLRFMNTGNSGISVHGLIQYIMWDENNSEMQSHIKITFPHPLTNITCTEKQFL